MDTFSYTKIRYWLVSYCCESRHLNLQNDLSYVCDIDTYYIRQ